ncbi:uncharacterized protein F4822DRAFT_56018 [Hypoxylon trugodes]|uniref:uncharacterized protein n=1 Tax=Hypoxylon trugodes TaxID=326681 RepID=UPI002193DC8A|nr:uncharacterized protein F4822DRAFT_56018 [Hypoxylon trugodes]KAI1383938.1 hypothetical protein F4822DRAFT_56018 [Hypoxylon trugodes]
MPPMAFIESWSLASFLAPLHLLSYSALLGTELYQTFIVTKVCYQELPRSAFTTLQKRIFPLYFRGQSLLLLLTAATIPPYGPFTLQASKGNWIPFVIAGVTALLNLTVYGPRTRKIMIDRIHQETRDGTKSTGIDVELSDDMRAFNRSFSRNHAMSIHLNLISIGAMAWWGWKLASRLDIQSL